jgi:hypothetical protein
VHASMIITFICWFRSSALVYMPGHSCHRRFLKGVTPKRYHRPMLCCEKIFQRFRLRSFRANRFCQRLRNLRDATPFLFRLPRQGTTVVPTLLVPIVRPLDLLYPFIYCIWLHYTFFKVRAFYVGLFVLIAFDTSVYDNWHNPCFIFKDYCICYSFLRIWRRNPNIIPNCVHLFRVLIRYYSQLRSLFLKPYNSSWYVYFQRRHIATTGYCTNMRSRSFWLE